MSNKQNKQETEDSALVSFRSFVLILLIGVLCFYAMMSNTKNTGQVLPMIFGKGCAVVMTGSMEPTLPVDAMIFVDETRDYEVGDIVVIQDYYNLVVHRIVSINGNEVTTKGDANNVEDEPTLISEIRGEVVGHIPKVGVAVRLMKSPVGSLSLIGLVLLIWSFSGKKKGSEDDEEDGDED